MAITVTQPTPGEPPLAIEVTGLPWARAGGVSAIVQRSTDGGVRWTTVRGLADVPVPPPPGLHLTGFYGDYASTPDTASLDITGDIDIRVDLTAGATEGIVVAKAAYDEPIEVSFDFYILPSGVAGLDWSPDGESVLSSESDPVPSLVSRQRGTIRVTLDVDDNGHHVITWYTGPTVDGPWTPLGEPQVAAGTTAIYASAKPLAVGAFSDGAAGISGVIHAVKILDGVDGTPVVDVRFDEQPSGATEFEDATGLRWTVHGDAEILTEPPIGARDWEFRPGVENRYRVGVHQILDRFDRYVEGAWGDTNTGQTWLAQDGGLFVLNGWGEMTLDGAPSSGVNFLLVPDDVGDADLSVTFATNAEGGISGGPVSASLIGRGGIAARVTIAAGGAMSIAVAVEGIDQVTAALPTTYTGSESYRIRLRMDHLRIRAKCWDLEAGPEPDWQVEYIAHSAPRGGAIGLGAERSADNSNGGFAAFFADFMADIGQPQWVGGTDTITPTLDRPWLCSVMRSFLNRPITIRSYQEPSRAARGGLTPIAHRTLPIAQVELAGGREWPLEIRAADLAEARWIEWIVASGDVLWLLVPAGSPIPGGYYRVGQLDARHHRQQGPTRWLTLPLVEVAAPGPDVVTAQSTVDTVLALYGTVEDLLAQVPTVEALLDLVGDPSEVIVDQ